MKLVARGKQHRKARGRVAILVRDQRTDAGLTQAELSKRAGVNRGTVIAAEARDARSSVRFCLKVAGALGLSLRTILHAHLIDAVED